MNSSIMTLVEETINDNNAELIRDFILYLKSRVPKKGKPLSNFSIQCVLLSHEPRKGHEYNRRSIYHFAQTLTGYNGVLIDTVHSTFNHKCLDTYSFNDKSGELVREVNNNDNLIYWLQDDGYKIRDDPVKGDYIHIYQYNKSHVLHRIIYKKFGEETNIFEISKDDAAVIHVEIKDNAKDHVDKIPECVRMIKDNIQLIDKFHLAPKFNKK